MCIMKKIIKGIIKTIKKYLPDAIIIIGTWILSYNLFRPPKTITKGLVLERPSLAYTYTDCHTEWKTLGVVLIVIGIDIAIRYYIVHKKTINP